MLNREATLADTLFDVGAVKFGAFRLKLHDDHPDVPLSPIYLNLRTPENNDGPLTPEILRQITFLMSIMLARDFQFVAGIPKAGEPIAEALAEWLEEMWPGQIRLLHFGKEETEGGRRITGIVEEVGVSETDNRILVVDDLVTQADTKFEAVGSAEAAGLTVAGIVVLVDRQQGGAEQLAKHGYHVRSVFALSALLDYYVESGRITQPKADEVNQYLDANRV